MVVRRTTLLAGLLLAACAPHNISSAPAHAPSPVPQATATDTVRPIPATVQFSPPQVPVPPARNAIAPESLLVPPPQRTSTPDVYHVPDRAVALMAPDTVPADTIEFPMLSLDQYASHDRVQYYLKLFSGDARERIGERLTAGTRYDPYIRGKLRAAGIPEDMTYLALIESGYNPHDYSSAAAVGMWQFMTTTAKDYGLRVDWWVDERRDPMRATDAAIHYLNDLRGKFGSIYLAAAAYNGGEGRVSRGLSRLAVDLKAKEPDDQFFSLASTNLLRAETKNYVPQLIAAAIIARDPRAYGIRIDTLAPIAFDSVFVPRLTGVSAVAKACNTGAKDILDLNGQILRGMTPPDGSVWMRVPVGCGATFDGGLAALDSADRRGASFHTVKKGETPASIAQKAGISLANWRKYNPKVKATSGTPLTTGSQVLIPTRETLGAARDVPDPGIERYGTAVGGVYEVRKGDTLGKIAERNHTTVAAIKKNNHIKGDVITVGQKLRIAR
ncbi:MAG TPA: transglycosylase SLT domain-containing protein [Gemmatimonadaceae bacterium]|nr:transglycosylase SLT domain-containing protein [Gemmatimonadaceae bacterium]